MSEERTEPATPKRRREARRRGQVVRSAELAQAAGFVAIVAMLPITLPKLTAAMRVDWEILLSNAAGAETGSGLGHAGTLFTNAFTATAPLLAAVALTAVGAQVAITGARPNPHLIKPKFSHISPKSGVKRLVSKQVIWELARTVAKIGLLAMVSIGAWQLGLRELLASSGTLESLLGIVGGTLQSLLVRMGAIAAIIGIVDAVVSRRRHMKQIKMTKQEVKDEHRQSEGNPATKSAIRGRQMKLSRSRMIAAVAGADVVLTNPTHVAVALKYSAEDEAPIVVAKGAGAIAARIRAEATKHGVTMVENKPLARALWRAVEVGDAIPVAMYRAVAEILASVYRARRSRFAPLASAGAGGLGGSW